MLNRIDSSFSNLQPYNNFNKKCQEEEVDHRHHHAAAHHQEAAHQLAQLRRHPGLQSTITITTVLQQEDPE